MIEGLLLTFFIFVTPIFGKSIDSSESVIFYSIPIIISTILLINYRDKIKISLKQIIFQIIFILLTVPSLFTSISPSNSYYGFFVLLNTILAINLSLFLIKKDQFIKWIIIFASVYSSVLILNKLGVVTLEPKIKGDNVIMQYWGHSYYGDFLVATIPCIIAASANPLILLLNLFALVLTNSRSALAGAILALFLYKFKNKIVKKIMLIFLIVASLFIWNQVVNGKIPQKDLYGRRVDYWIQALKGIKNQPFFGNGFNTFQIISEKNRVNIVDYVSQPHNLILSQWSDTGIFATIFILFIIFSKLKFNFSKDNLFFAIFLGLVLDSCFDPVFNSPGIVIIAFYLLLYPSYQEEISQLKKPKLGIIYLSILTIFVSIHAFSRTTSDFLYTQKNYQLSSQIDPFNLNPRLKLAEYLDSSTPQWQQSINQMFKIAPYDSNIFDLIFKYKNLPDNENFYYQIFSYNPQGGCKNYVKLAEYYEETKQTDKLNNLLQTVDNTYKENEMFGNCAIHIAHINYSLALETYKTNLNQAISYLQRSVKLTPKLSHFRIELANLYWLANNKDQARNQLQTCLKYTESQIHCQYYIEQHPNEDYGYFGSSQIRNELDQYVKQSSTEGTI